MKIVKSLEESGLLIKGVSKTVKNEFSYSFFIVLLTPFINSPDY